MLGATCQAVIRATQRIFIPEESDCPYQFKSQLEKLALAIPEAATLVTKRTEITLEALDALELAHEHVPAKARCTAKYGAETCIGLSRLDPSSLESILASQREIVAYFNLRWQKNPSTQVYDYDETQKETRLHVMLIVGYDRERKIFTIKNSWGEASFIQVSYEFVENCITNAYYIKKVRNPLLPAQYEAFFLGVWHINAEGFQGVLVLRRFVKLNSPFPSLPTQLGHYYDDRNLRQTVYGLIKGRTIFFSLIPVSSTPVTDVTLGEYVGNLNPGNAYAFSGTFQTGKTTGKFSCQRKGPYYVIPVPAPMPSIEKILKQWIMNCAKREQKNPWQPSVIVPIFSPRSR